MIGSMPGGLAGVKQMIADFHRRGVRVLFPMMMWDQGTRDPGLPWPHSIAGLLAEVGADGIDGDTQDGVPLTFSLAADKTGHPLAFEPEGSPADEALAWNVMTWGQYQLDDRQPQRIRRRWRPDGSSGRGELPPFRSVPWSRTEVRGSARWKGHARLFDRRQRIRCHPPDRHGTGAGNSRHDGQNEVLDRVPLVRLFARMKGPAGFRQITYHARSRIRSSHIPREPVHLA